MENKRFWVNRGELRKASSLFHRLAQMSHYPIDKQRLWQAMIEIFGGTENVPFYEPTNFRRGDKMIPGLVLSISKKDQNHFTDPGVSIRLSELLEQKLGVEHFIAYVKYLHSA